MRDTNVTNQPTQRRVHPIGTVRPPLTCEETVAKRAWLMFEDISEVYAFARWMMDMWGLGDWKLEFPSRFPKDLLGRCNHNKQTLQFDREYCLGVRIALAMDVIFHEIAHAIQGIEVAVQFEDCRRALRRHLARSSFKSSTAYLSLIRRSSSSGIPEPRRKTHVPGESRR